VVGRAPFRPGREKLRDDLLYERDGECGKRMEAGGRFDARINVENNSARIM
jgi:hypothetical protein